MGIEPTTFGLKVRRASYPPVCSPSVLLGSIRIFARLDLGSCPPARIRIFPAFSDWFAGGDDNDDAGITSAFKRCMRKRARHTSQTQSNPYRLQYGLDRAEFKPRVFSTLSRQLTAALRSESIEGRRIVSPTARGNPPTSAYFGFYT